MLTMAVMSTLAGSIAPAIAQDNNTISNWTGPGGIISSPVTGTWSASNDWDAAPTSGINAELRFYG